MDMKRASLPLLLSLDALLTELNVTRAALRLHVSQSTLSGHLARLREVFQDPLLVASETGRGMVPTERALALRPRLAEALAILREVVEDPLVFDAASSHRTFVVAANDTVFTIVGADAMTRVLRSGNPGLRIATVPGSDPNLVERMARGEIDLYICDIAKMPGALKARPLLDTDYAFAQRRGHPRGLQPPDLDDYCQVPHVIVSERADLWTPVDDELAKLGRRRTVAAAVPSYSQIPLILGGSDCVATLPRALLRNGQEELDLIELPFPMPRFRLAMGWHPRAQEDRAVSWLRDQFLEGQSDGARQGGA
ncbi:LysR family transcriptional regulator [Mitsuaria sp. 7]|uniref:LysR family transcriptional regulator n=1 Tax=Mitsuaria sp. 7 TaxID=1658665 RepID=UPI0007DE0B67|nr:LysR family transcriptional regulator [Mitsuaria sp. 7]ANH66582.1 LysR family transcriptional regulator [Mitsuaria sp. 7]